MDDRVQVEEYIENEDIEFEHLLLRNPYVLKSWLSYIEHKRAQMHTCVAGTETHMRYTTALNMIYERAVASLPGSYKLWKSYLDERILQVANLYVFSSVQFSYIVIVICYFRRHLGRFYTHTILIRCITDPQYDLVNHVFERCMHYMHKMPVIWLLWLRFLLKQRLFTQCRRIFDRALQSLPLTQHHRLWKFAIDEFIPDANINTLGIHLFKRYLQVRNTLATSC